MNQIGGWSKKLKQFKANNMGAKKRGAHDSMQGLQQVDLMGQISENIKLESTQNKGFRRQYTLTKNSNNIIEEESPVHKKDTLRKSMNAPGVRISADFAIID